MSDTWRPSAQLEMLHRRAALLKALRGFFDQQGYLEVETPALSHFVNPDPNIESFCLEHAQGELFLHTSPEFPMKRLLAAGSGSIYQICKVFRQGEIGRLHNPEFTMVEWYRLGFSYYELMDEIDDLLQDCCGLKQSKKLTYSQAFEQILGLNIFQASVVDLQQCLLRHGLQFSDGIGESVDIWRDLVLSHLIEPHLGQDQPTFIYDYPASQASLACVVPGETPIAQRFELYINGIEIANGYQELRDGSTQRQRFEEQWLSSRTRESFRGHYDSYLVEALLEAELPYCSGVAMGLDRLLMVLSDTKELKEVLSFDFERA